MKSVKVFLIFTLVMTLFSCKTRKESIAPFAPTSNEVYASDTILMKEKNKKAIIIIAHDDDMCAMSGTMSKLNKAGWEIRVLSFHKDALRDAAQIKACENILDTVMFFDLKYSDWRLDLSTTKEEELYHPIDKNKFSEVFNENIVKEAVISQVNNFNPSVIFTLDNEVGGYGHPEHVFISQLVFDLLESKTLHVPYIFQSVYTPNMTNSIMERHSKRMIEWGFAGDGWLNAKNIYHVDGMPLPTIQINITSEAKEKMRYLNSYNERERKTIGFFIPAFFEYSAEEYFKVFDREFFRVIHFN
jgi:LmbE family N-acetylglucosaminyl deacetylase